MGSASRTVPFSNREWTKYSFANLDKTQRGTNMSCVIGQCNSMRKPTLKFERRFKALAIAALLGLPLLTAYPLTISVVAQQDSPPGAKVRIANIPRKTAPNTAAGDDVRPPELSSLDIPLLISDCDRLGTAMHSQLPEYTYLQTRHSRELDQRGKMVEHSIVYEAYPIKVQGHLRHVISMISEDGAPLSPN